MPRRPSFHQLLSGDGEVAFTHGRLVDDQVSPQVERTDRIVAIPRPECPGLLDWALLVLDTAGSQALEDPCGLLDPFLTHGHVVAVVPQVHCLAYTRFCHAASSSRLSATPIVENAIEKHIREKMPICNIT